MPAFLVELPESAATVRAKRMVVIANAAGDAKDICKAKYSGDAGDAAWEAATVTALTDVTMATANALVGWRFNVSVRDTTGAETHNFSAVGDATDDTLDEVGVLLATAGAALAGLTSTYAANVLEVATIGDGIGDSTLVLTVQAPVNNDAQGIQQAGDSDISDAFLTSYTHEGIAGAVLKVTFVADTAIVPQVLAAF